MKMKFPTSKTKIQISIMKMITILKVKMQMNLMSLAGGYGKSAQDKAQSLLAKGYYSFFGSDLHRLAAFLSAINTKALKKETVTLLPRIQNVIL